MDDDDDDDAVRMGVTLTDKRGFPFHSLRETDHLRLRAESGARRRSIGDARIDRGDRGGVVQAEHRRARDHENGQIALEGVRTPLYTLHF